MDLAFLFAGDTLSVLGTYFNLVAVAALTFSLTHDVGAMSLQLGAASLTQIPARPVDAPGFSRGTGARLPPVFACSERAILWT